MNWHDPSAWAAVVPAVGLLIVLLGVAWRVIRWIVRQVRKWVHLMDDLTGEAARPGIPARPGVLERIAAIEHQFEPNAGHSMRDAVDRVEQKAEHAATLAAESSKTTERAMQQHIWHVEKLHVADPDHHPMPPERTPDA